MTRVTWLPQVLRDAGLDVVEYTGWKGRGVDRLNILGVVAHHTATSAKSTDTNVAKLLAVGRPDLAGPLSQLGLDRRGRFWMIADGRCNHNGFGTWGNDAIGIEAFNTGTGEPWPAVQLDAYIRGVAAICMHKGWSADRLKAHRETDPRRKIDPTGIDMNHMRSRVTAVIAARSQRPADDNNLELTMGQYEDIMREIGHLRNQVTNIGHAVHGSDVGTSRDESIYFNTKYLRGELLGGDAAPRLRQILKRFGDPKFGTTPADPAGDAACKPPAPK